jgi:hypothetical protein
MGLAALLSRSLRLRIPLLKGIDSLPAIRQASIVCLFASAVVALASSRSSADTGSIISILRQVDNFPIMTVVLATVYEIRVSEGKRSINWIVVAGVAFMFVLGVLSFSKEGMLLGPATWLVTAMLSRYNFPTRHLVAGGLGMAFVVYYLVPYSQYVRNYATSSFSQNLTVAVYYLSDLGETRRLFEDAIGQYDLGNEPHLFDERVPLMDRAIMLPPDDTLIHYTQEGNVFGLLPTFHAYANIVPHFIWHGKTAFRTGNVYAHELGELSEEDDTTGISFSPAADAYHQAKWLGILLLLPVDCFLAFLVADSLVGNARQSPWVVVWIVGLSHVAPEGGLDGLVYLATYGAFAMAFTVWVTRAAAWALRVIAKAGGAPTLPDSPQAASAWRPV